MKRALVYVDRRWAEYLMGTKAYSVNGGYWTRVEGGWKWCTGDTFPTPGADACGACIEFPAIDIVDRLRWHASYNAFELCQLEAANEIEQLRTASANLADALSLLRQARPCVYEITEIVSCTAPHKAVQYVELLAAIDAAIKGGE